MDTPPVVVTQPVYRWSFPLGCDQYAQLVVTMPVLDREPDHIPYQIGSLEPVFDTDPADFSILPGFPEHDTVSHNRPIYGRGGNWGNRFVDPDFVSGRWSVYVDGVLTVEVLADDGDGTVTVPAIYVPGGGSWHDDHTVWLECAAWEDVPPYHYWDYTLHPIGVSAWTPPIANSLSWHNPDVNDRGSKFTDGFEVVDRRGDPSPLDWGPFGPSFVPPKWLLTDGELFINPVGTLLFPEYVDGTYWDVATEPVPGPHCPQGMHVNQRV